MFKKPYRKKKKKKLPTNIRFHLIYDFHYISFNYLFRSNDTVYGFLRLLSDVSAVNVQRPSSDAILSSPESSDRPAVVLRSKAFRVDHSPDQSPLSAQCFTIVPTHYY